MFAVPPNTIAPAATPPSAHPALIARQYAQDRTTWSHLLRYDPETRFATLVARTEHQEVWLMSWLPGQRTDLHSHGPAVGAFTVISGTLTERVHRDHTEEVHLLRPGQTRVFAPGYVHEVRNIGPDPAVSLHVYRATRPHGGGYPVSTLLT